MQMCLWYLKPYECYWMYLWMKMKDWKCINCGGFRLLFHINRYEDLVPMFEWFEWHGKRKERKHLNQSQYIIHCIVGQKKERKTTCNDDVLNAECMQINWHTLLLKWMASIIEVSVPRHIYERYDHLQFTVVKKRY